MCQIFGYVRYIGHSAQVSLLTFDDSHFADEESKAHIN